MTGLRSRFIRLGMRIALALALILLFCAPPVLAEVKVEVRLFDTVPAPRISQVWISGRFRAIQPASLQVLPSLIVRADRGRLRLASQDKRLIGEAPRLVLAAMDPNGVCVRRDASFEMRCYAGTVMILPKEDGSLSIRNTVSRRDYLLSVLAGETLPGWPLEALKAQAVLSRTRLLRKPVKKNLFGEPVVSLSDSTTDEAYPGIRKNHSVSQAVKDTWKDVLTYDNRPVEAFYHSTCAGHTSDDGYFSGQAKGRHAYSLGVACPYCKASPFYKTHVSRVPLSRWQAYFPYPVRLSSPDNAGRFRQSEGGAGAYGVWLAVGRYFGWDKAPGTLFSIRRTQDSVEVKSRGAGHGVGLCQWGAAGMARQGYGYREILRFYYPKASLQWR